MIPFTLLKKRSPRQKMRAKAQKGGPYHLPQKVLLSCELLAIPAASTVSTLPTVIIETLVSQRTLLYARCAAYSLRSPPPPRGN
jgi:hypothetical protein